MKRYGLIGYPLGHSFSKAYFSEKFDRLGLKGTHQYDLFELKEIDQFPALWTRHEGLQGVNVTVPYKQEVMRFLSRLDESAGSVGAVNVIKNTAEGLVGYNSDLHGFQVSLESFLESIPDRALVLGTGGASKAVCVCLQSLGVEYHLVSRKAGEGVITYADLTENTDWVAESHLIINTTPLGMSPKVDAKPDLPYHAISNQHYLYDLVYNPEQTAFMKAGLDQGAKVKNGLEMLHGQADRAWEIWNS